MNVSCPQCQTTFRVDPAQIPEDGVRARCSQCGDVFSVTSQATGGPPAAAPDGPAAPDESAPGSDASARSAASSSRPEPQATDPSPSSAAPEPSAPEPPTPSAPPTPSEDSPPSSDAGASPAPPVFGSQDPKDRARRIARALISDIAAYHSEQVKGGVDAGSLRAEFKDEILKSWEEYVDQVGKEVAESTPYFRDALNDILANGEKVF